jgi:DNA-binding winged helix-turn-helix (wHTH) protein/TolB-like protein
MRATHNPVLRYSCIRFGVFEFNPEIGELRRQGLRIKLLRNEAKALSLLLERRGEVCLREEFQQRLWPKNMLINSERALNKVIHGLRSALGDSAASPIYIQTVAGEGYSFISTLQGPPTFVRGTRRRRRLDSLAMLPLIAQHADHDLDFLNKRIVERIIDRLSNIGIKIQAFRTVQRYRDQELNLRTVGRELLVSAIAAGEVVQRDGQLHLHIEMIDVEDGSQLWGAQFTDAFPEILDDPGKLVDKICEQMRQILAPTIEPAA